MDDVIDSLPDHAGDCDGTGWGDCPHCCGLRLLLAAACADLAARHPDMTMAEIYDLGAMAFEAQGAIDELTR